MKLYEISDSYLRLLDADGADINAEAELSKLDVAFSEKSENIAKLIRSLNANSNAITTEIKRLTRTARRTQHRLLMKTYPSKRDTNRRAITTAWRHFIVKSRIIAE